MAKNTEDENLESEKPSDAVESRINSAIQEVAEKKKNGFSFDGLRESVGNAFTFSPETRGRLVNALMGGLGGLKAGGDVASSDSDLLSLLTGAAGGLTAPGAYRAQQETQGLTLEGLRADVKKKQLEVAPIESILGEDSQLLKEHPEVRGMPAAMFNKYVLPGIQSKIKFQNALDLARKKEEWRDDNNTVDEVEAQNISKSYAEFGMNIPAERLVGQRRSALAFQLPKVGFDKNSGSFTMLPSRVRDTTQVGGIEASKRTQAYLDSMTMIESFRDDWEKLVKSGKVGRLEGTKSLGLAKATGGSKESEVFSYDNMKEAFLSSLKDVVGQSGVLSNQDMNQLASLLPGVQQDGEYGRKQYAKMFAIMEKRKKNLQTAFPKSTPGGASGAITQEMKDRATAELKRRADAARKSP